MMETVESWLLNTFWGQITLIGALLVIVVWAIFAMLTERLFGKTTVNRIVKEREDWKQAYFTEAKAHGITQESLREATRSLEVTDAVVKALRREATDGSE